MNKVSRLSYGLLVLFVLSGFAGLIYQSVWSHYLGLTLGHAAYAQTLVLAIYMGGMAVGAWLASHYSVRWKRLILGYAVVEGVIGVLGLVFHQAFVAYTSFSQETVLPGLSSISLAHSYQWVSAALMITPQSIMLGATFPLMSAGLIRAMPNEHGEVLGGLYFTNSLGAALGALMATFVLLPAVGLPGTVMAAALINIVVAIGAWALSKMLVEVGPPTGPAVAMPVSTEASAESPDEVRRLGLILLWATAVSGAASFVYEVGWVRLLNQALGTTIHSFELMLAAFICGLAFGGLWIRKRAKHIIEPVRYVGYVQIFMAIAALISIPIFTQSFHWVGWIMGSLSRSSSGYVLYELATAVISLLVMFPAAFLAGMTLPLFTLALLRAGAGERSIGRIYAANTLGAIAGVAIAMHVLIPLMGVRLAVTLAALVDGLVGLYLLRVINPARLTKPFVFATLAMIGAVAFSVLLGRPDPLQQVAGVFRTGQTTLPDTATVEYLRDGKTATVSMFSSGNIKTISTNGKPDASLTPMEDAPTQDEITMIMAGALPLALHPQPRQIAVIGWGSGLTTHTLMGSSVPEVVDTIEIEQAMVEGAKFYGDRVALAYTDPRSKIYINDARTFFSTGARKYDAIISEPSNPWVSGVAGLFTHEFYAFLKRHLNEGGMLVQWLHMYEISDPLVGTMMAALAAEFPQTDLYLTNTADILIVARADGPERLPVRPIAAGEVLQEEMRRVGLGTPEQIQLRHIGGGEVLRNFVRMLGAQPHSDYYPTVSLQAPKARFIGLGSNALPNLVTNGMPVLDILDCRKPLGRDVDLPHSPHSEFSTWRKTALAVARAAETGTISHALVEASPASIDGVLALRSMSQTVSGDPQSLRLWSGQAAGFARATLGLLPAEDLIDSWVNPTWLPAAVMEVPEVAAVMAAYSAAARRAPNEMRQRAETVLALPSASLSPQLREQMLVIAMLGALGSGNPVAVSEMDERWGPSLSGATRDLMAIRSYLLAWADGSVPACAARAQ